MKSRFYLYKRNRKKSRPVYYAKIKLPDGSISTGVCTGETVRSKAEAWAAEKAVQLCGESKSLEIPTLETFSVGFFEWDSDWSLNRRASGKRHSKMSCREKGIMMRHHILPALGNLRLDKIDSVAIRNFRNYLFQKGYSGSLINKCLMALNTIILSAEELGHITKIPRIEKAALRTKERGILSIQEMQRIFSDEIQWWDFRARVGSMLSATTGLRIGEVQAITLSDLNLKDKYIRVRRSWNEVTREINPTTKSGRERNVILSSAVVREIQELIEIHPTPDNPESFLFFAAKKQDKPMEKKLFIRALYKAFKDIGIDETIRQERRLCFHSWRHFANSMFISAGLPLMKVQQMIGHSSIAMSQLYYHIPESEMEDFRVVQEKVLQVSSGEEEEG